MDTHNASQIMDIFLKNKAESENYLSQYGQSGKDKNNGVTLSYERIAKIDPLFFWFSAATLGSNQVGKIIGLTENKLLMNCEKTNTVSLGFAYGNQEIHNNVIALYNTYQDHGIEGLYKLKEADKLGVYISDNALRSFETYSDLQTQAKKYSGEVHLQPNDPMVIHHILSQSDNLNKLKEATILIVQHEQAIVQPMYYKTYYDDGKSVGEILNDSSFLEKLLINKAELAGAKILDTYISTDNVNMTSYDERMSYFNKVFDEFFRVLAQEDGFEKLIEQRETVVASLGVDFIAYGEHFQDGGHLSQLIADSLIDNTQHVDSVALTWDNALHQWKQATNVDITKYTNGIWVSPDTYPEAMNLINKFPLVENTFYFDQPSGQSYVFCGAGFLPNLSPGYTWLSLKTYMKPSSSGYEDGGKLWMLSKISPNSTIADGADGLSNSSKSLTLAQVLDFGDNSLNILLNKLTMYESVQQVNPYVNANEGLSFNDLTSSNSIINTYLPIPVIPLEMTL